jgi:putative ABC transport system permease protein
MGFQMMLVPLGCPYDGAARVLKGKTLENSLPESILEQARRDPAVAVAAPLLMVSPAGSGKDRADMWVGLDEAALSLKPWWRMAAGEKWFSAPNSVILGCDAAEIELRAPGDWLYSPETGEKLRVAGVLERSGTSDDSLFFVPLATAQRMFNQPGRLTAIAIRLQDPALSSAARDRLQSLPGAQVVTLTEMMGTFVNLLGAVRTLLYSVGLLALVIAVLSVFNTLLAAVVERTNELCVLRAIGASRVQIVSLIITESLLLTSVGSLCGILLAFTAGGAVENFAKQFVPLAPQAPLFSLNATILWQSMLIGVVVGVTAGLYPSWQASRLHPAEALKGE